MNVLLVYGSKYGSTKKCSELLKDQLNGNVELVDIKSGETLDLKRYEMVIIGSAVYMGKIQKEVSEFCKNYIEELKNKKIAVFLCCMNEKDIEKQINENFPKVLLDNSIVTGYFGGEFNFTKMNFIEKNIIKMVAKTLNNDEEKFQSLDMKKDVSMIEIDKINKFAEVINLN